MSQGIKRGSKFLLDSPTDLFLSSISKEQPPRHDKSIPYKAVGRFIEIKSNLRRNKFYKTNQGYNFLGGSFSNRDNVRAPIRFGRERVPA